MQWARTTSMRIHAATTRAGSPLAAPAAHSSLSRFNSVIQLNIVRPLVSTDSTTLSSSLSLTKVTPIQLIPRDGPTGDCLRHGKRKGGGMALRQGEDRQHPLSQSLTPRRGGAAISLTGSTLRQTTQNWRYRFFRGEVWLEALHVLSILLGNSLACVALAWIANFIYSRGNILTRRSAEMQSDFEFIAGVTIVANVIFFCTVVVVQLPVLQTMQYVSVPEDEKPYRVLLFCLGRLLKHTYRVYLLSLALALGVVYALRGIEDATQMGTREFYFCCTISQLNNTSLSIAARRIFVEDSVLGRSKLRSSRKRTCWSSAVKFVKVFVLSSPKAATVALAGVYVQVVSGYHIEGMLEFAAFSLGSLALKLLVKKIAKLGVMRFNVNNPRSIFVVIGLPTVLIDTQVRIVLQRVPGAKYTLIWTFGMAVLEITTRVSKVILTKREIRQKESQVAAEVARSFGGASTASHQSMRSHRGELRKATATDPRAASMYALERWKRRVLTFQIAESYANISAEYIAIGCSTSILYFYWDHPKYKLGGDGVKASTSILPWSRTSTLGVQVLVEFLVDYLSCVLEIGEGVDFQRIRQYRAFLGLLFVSLATINIQICALMYFKV